MIGVFVFVPEASAAIKLLLHRTLVGFVTLFSKGCQHLGEAKTTLLCQKLTGN
jgi:hypothetical protein